MTIYHQGVARVAYELPMTPAERDARVQLAAMQRLVDARDPNYRDLSPG